jgi:hypothetical protein
VTDSPICGRVTGRVSGTVYLNAHVYMVALPPRARSSPALS